MPIRVLVALPDAARREAAARALGKGDCAPVLAATEEEFLAAAEDGTAEVVLVDKDFPGVWIGEFLREIADRPRRPAVLVVADKPDRGLQETALSLGAAGVLSEPLDLAALPRRVLEAHEWVRTVVPAGPRGLRPGEDLRDLLGASRAMAPVLTQLIRVWNHDVTVLLTGERGTGKGVVGRLLHERGPRRTRSFVEVNCASLGAALLESELFGHEKGAFTDARTEKRGILEVADGGTLFLDEIGDMPGPVQPKVLTALETKRFRRVGGTEERRADVRLIASTNHDLGKGVAEGRFRGDLYDRLNVVSIHIPPLRDRGGDVLSLARLFVAEFAGKYGEPVAEVSPAAAARLSGYAWPGNVRELRNVVERAVLLCQGTAIRPEDLPGRISGLGDSGVRAGTGGFPTLEESEKDLVSRVIAHVKGNRHKAATILGISRSTLLGKIRRYGLE
ncbi:MAG: sigma-54 dependent transcriptional regulator [Planctomycetales bacterium]|nr:sigma-54 dependent transcriptional regulator [Planctomycetales bacterium]